MRKVFYLIGIIFTLAIGIYCYVSFYGCEEEKTAYYVLNYTPAVKQYGTDYKSYLSEPTIKVKRVFYDNDSVAIERETANDIKYHDLALKGLHNSANELSKDLKNDSLRRVVNSYYKICNEEWYMLIIYYQHTSSRDNLVKYAKEHNDLQDIEKKAEQLGVSIYLQGI